MKHCSLIIQVEKFYKLNTGNKKKKHKNLVKMKKSKRVRNFQHIPFENYTLFKHYPYKMLIKYKTII